MNRGAALPLLHPPLTTGPSPTTDRWTGDILISAAPQPPGTTQMPRAALKLRKNLAPIPSPHPSPVRPDALPGRAGSQDVSCFIGREKRVPGLIALDANDPMA